jgi:hypothetical protein
MLRLNGLSAWITVDHEPLPTYTVHVDQEQNLATCWVASTVGKVRVPLSSKLLKKIFNNV